MNKVKPLVYVASPYTQGDQAINTRFQCEIFDKLLVEDIVWPFVPLWSHFQHQIFPREYDHWVKWGLAVIPRMDACLRLDAVYKEMDYKVTESKGADAEVALAKQLNKPVFYDIESLYEWALKQNDSKPASSSQGFLHDGYEKALAEFNKLPEWVRKLWTEGK